MKSVKFHITSEAPGDPPRTVLIDSFPCSIGRAKECGLRLDHVTVSEVHAILFASEKGITLRDNESAEGVMIDGERVREVRLARGHRLRIGEVALDILHVSGDLVGLKDFGRQVVRPGPRAESPDRKNYLGEAAYFFVSAATVSAAVEYALKSSSVLIAGLGALFYVLGTAVGAALFSFAGRFFWGEWKFHRLLWFFGLVQLVNVFVLQPLPVIRFQFGADSVPVRAMEAFGLAAGAAGWWYYSERFTEGWGRKVFAALACLQLLGAAAVYSRYLGGSWGAEGFEEIYRPLLPIEGPRYSREQAIEDMRDGFKRLEAQSLRRSLAASP